jgi:hypothetical protein
MRYILFLCLLSSCLQPVTLLKQPDYPVFITYNYVEKAYDEARWYMYLEYGTQKCVGMFGEEPDSTCTTLPYLSSMGIIVGEYRLRSDTIWLYLNIGYDKYDVCWHIKDATNGFWNPTMVYEISISRNEVIRSGNGTMMGPLSIERVPGTRARELREHLLAHPDAVDPWLRRKAQSLGWF